MSQCTGCPKVTAVQANVCSPDSYMQLTHLLIVVRALLLQNPTYVSVLAAMSHYHTPTALPASCTICPAPKPTMSKQQQALVLLNEQCPKHHLCRSNATLSTASRVVHCNCKMFCENQITELSGAVRPQALECTASACTATRAG